MEEKRLKGITGTNQVVIGYKVYAIQNGVVAICAGGISEEEDKHPLLSVTLTKYVPGRYEK